MYSFQRLVPALVIFVLMYGIVSDAMLAATIASSFAPIAVEIKFQKENDMESNSLSNLPKSAKTEKVAARTKVKDERKVKTNPSKWSWFCKVLKDEVRSFQRLVPALVIFVLMYGIVSDAMLGDHIILATHAWGRYEW